MKRKDIVQYNRSPVILFFVLALSVFAAEVLIMYALSFLDFMSITANAFFDSLILISIMFPLLYFFMLKPIMRYSQELEKDAGSPGVHLSEQLILAKLGSDIGMALAKNDGLKSSLNACTDALVDNLDALFARIWIADGDILKLIASSGIYTHIDGEHSVIPIGKYKIGTIASEKTPHFTNDVLNDPMVHNKEWVKSNSIVSFAGHPIIIGERLIGVIAIFSSKKLMGITLKSLDSVSDILALGIDRIMADIKLKISESNLRSVFDSVNDAIFILDLKGNLIEVNSIAYERLGYKKEELLSMHISELDPPEFAAKVPERIEQIMKHGRAVFESAHIRKDGSIMPVEINSIMTTFKGEKVLLSTIRDITERMIASEQLKTHEKQLSESEQKFRTFFDMAPMAIIINPLKKDGSPNIDRQLKHATLNNRLCEFLGYSEDELNEMTPLDITHPDDRTPNLIRNQELIEGKINSYSFKKRYIKKDGSAMWGNLVVVLLRDASGIPTHTMNTLVDITENKLADDILRESEKKYRSLAENLPAIVYRINLRQENKVQFFNNMISTMTGYEYAKPGKGAILCLEKLVVDGDREEVMNTINNSVLLNTSYNIEYRIVHNDGNIRYFQEYGIPVCDTDGEPLFIDAIIFDITDRKKIEEELMQSKLDWEETFDTISDMVTIHDTNFNIIRANKAAREILKLDISEINKSLKCYSAYHGKSFPPEKCPSCACVTTGTSGTYELFEPKFDKHFEIRAMPRLSTNGKLLGVSHIVRDITAR
jgi:PAS domain S-box-containing protein